MYKRILNKAIALTLKPSFAIKDIKKLRKGVGAFERLCAIGQSTGSNTTIPLSACEMVHIPCEGADTQIFHVHGGAFCLPLMKLHLVFLNKLSVDRGAEVFAPDYRLAPEHPYPAALDDVLEGYQRVTADSPNKKIILMGDSAGGHLALALMHKIKQLKLPEPDRIVLLSPVADLSLSSASAEKFAQTDVMFRRADLQRLFTLYAPDPDLQDLGVNPLKGDFDQWPPMQIHASDAEILHDDAQAIADKYQDSQSAVEFKVWQQVPHVHPLLPLWPEAKKAYALILGFIKGSN